jgi:hypothetical protein
MRRFLAVSLMVLSIPALSQTAGPLEGKWVGTAQGRGGGELLVHLQLTGSAGTWQYPRQGAKGRNNPCLGVDFPVTVSSRTETELVIAIEGSKVLQGCENQSATFRVTDAKSLEGSLAEGRAVKLTRE